jgi:hypothetical protein
MDDVILIIFTSFVLLLFMVGFFRKQNVITIFSGVGFILLGVFLQQGVVYISGGEFVDLNLTSSNMTYFVNTWHSSYSTPIFFFLSLFGLAIIVIGVLDLISSGKRRSGDNSDVVDDSDEEG